MKQITPQCKANHLIGYYSLDNIVSLLNLNVSNTKWQRFIIVLSVTENWIHGGSVETLEEYTPLSDTTKQNNKSLNAAISRPCFTDTVFTSVNLWMYVVLAQFLDLNR